VEHSLVGLDLAGGENQRWGCFNSDNISKKGRHCLSL